MRQSAMLVLAALLAAPADECQAWGSRGHEWLSGKVRVTLQLFE